MIPRMGAMSPRPSGTAPSLRVLAVRRCSAEPLDTWVPGARGSGRQRAGWRPAGNAWRPRRPRCARPAALACVKPVERLSGCPRRSSIVSGRAPTRGSVGGPRRRSRGSPTGIRSGTAAVRWATDVPSDGATAHRSRGRNQKGIVAGSGAVGRIFRGRRGPDPGDADAVRHRTEGAPRIARARTGPAGRAQGAGPMIRIWRGFVSARARPVDTRLLAALRILLPVCRRSGEGRGSDCTRLLPDLGARRLSSFRRAMGNSMGWDRMRA